MKTIKIAHLYYDLMNLYGESGNILALKQALANQKVKCDVDLLTVDSKINWNKYDIFYMGMGTEDNQECVRESIIKYREEIAKNIKKKTFIMTGNAYELFGSTINGKEALGIFPFKSKTIRNRIVGEQFAKTYFLKDIVIGFQNRGSINNNEKNHLFEIIQGNGNNQGSINEGIHINNFYGSYLLGPLLIRNPHLTDYIIKNILDSYNYPYKEIKNTPDYQSYHEYLKNFYHE